MNVLNGDSNVKSLYRKLKFSQSTTENILKKSTNTLLDRNAGYSKKKSGVPSKIVIFYIHSNFLS